jgi:2,3-dihydroxybenzoate-AMP ligase
MMVRAGMVPWPREYVDRYCAAGYWTGVPLGTWPRSWERQYGDRIAVVDGDERLSFEDLDRCVDALAANLLGAGLVPGDNIVVQLPNCWQFVVLFFACQRIGVAPALALPAHRDQELTRVADRIQAAAIVVPDRWREYDHRRLAARVAARTPWPLRVLVLGDVNAPGHVDLRAMFTSAVAKDLDAVSPDPQDAAFFLLSGGTTGGSKLIARTHNDYGYSVRASVDACGYTADTVFLAALPMAHGLTLGGPGVLGVLAAGGRLVIAASPAPRLTFPLIDAERVTTTAVTPAVAHRWLQWTGGSTADLSSLEMLQVAGAPLSRAIAERIEPELGCRLQQVYGMSEGLHCYTRVGDTAEVVLGTQGRPISAADELRVVDPGQCSVLPGEIGELLVRGPTTIRGYFAEPVTNSRVFTADGWYRTGDLVTQDEQGNVTVRRRTKDVINRGGEKVSAAEVERPLLAMSQVAQASVVAVGDPELGERVCACIETRPGQRLGLAELRAACRSAGLADYMAPERIELFDHLPLTSIGKPDKQALRAAVAGRVAGGASAAATLSEGP